LSIFFSVTPLLLELLDPVGEAFLPVTQEDEPEHRPTEVEHCDGRRPVFAHS